MFTIAQERERARELFQLPRYSFHGTPVIESENVPKDEIWFFSWDREQMKFRLTKIINIGN